MKSAALFARNTYHNVALQPDVRRAIDTLLNYIEWESQYIVSATALTHLKQLTKAQLTNKKAGIVCCSYSLEDRTISGYNDTKSELLRRALNGQGVSNRFRLGNGSYPPQASAKMPAPVFFAQMYGFVPDEAMSQQAHMIKRLEVESGVSIVGYNPNNLRYIRNRIFRAYMASIIGDQKLGTIFVTDVLRTSVDFDVQVSYANKKKRVRFKVALDGCCYHAVDPETKIWISEKDDPAQGILFNQRNIACSPINGVYMGYIPQIELEVDFVNSEPGIEHRRAEIAEERLRRHFESYIGGAGSLIPKEESKAQAGYRLLDEHRKNAGLLHQTL